AAPDGEPHLAVEDDDGVAAARDAVAVERLRRAETVEREAADRRVATREEPLAGRQVAHDVDDRRAVRIDERLAVVAEARDVARQPAGDAEARAAGEDERRGAELPVEEALHVGLVEADLRPDAAAGELAVDARKSAALRVERVVAR